MIYIITHSEHADYSIIGASTDKAEAERICAEYSKDSRYDETRIEEFPNLDHSWDFRYEYTIIMFLADFEILHEYTNKVLQKEGETEPSISFSYLQSLEPKGNKILDEDRVVVTSPISFDHALSVAKSLAEAYREDPKTFKENHAQLH